MKIADERSGARVADEAQGPHTGRQLYNPAQLIRGAPGYLRPGHVRAGIIQEHVAWRLAPRWHAGKFRDRLQDQSS